MVNALYAETIIEIAANKVDYYLSRIASKGN